MTMQQKTHKTTAESARLNEVFAAQKEAYAKNPYPTMEERSAHLSALNKAIAQNKSALIEALNQDFGCRSETETVLTEILGSHGAIHYMQKNLRKLMRARRRHTGLWSMPAKNYVVAQPLGVVGIMSPWNYSLHLAVSPLACALAAGNRAMVVISEETPALYAVFSKLISDIFPENHVAVFQGGPISPEFASLPLDHLLFTGSTRVGKLIARSAAEHLTPITLELGGKSPAIVAPDYDLDEAAKRITWAKVFNAGQTCVAPDHAFIPKGTSEKFVKAAIAKFNKGYSGLEDKDLTAIISARFYHRLNDLVSEAESKGATIIRAGGLSPQVINGVHKMPLTLVLNAPDDCALMQEEIFGPILPIIEYDTIDEVTTYINERDRPLSLYVYSSDQGTRNDILRQTVSGSAGLNEALIQYIQEDMAFGGVGKSGYGSYHGKEGFDTFSHLKSVFHQRGFGKFAGIKLLHPPYGPKSKLLLRLMGSK